jgi:hypothetical protein
VVVRRSVAVAAAAAEAEGFSISAPSCSNWARAVSRVGPLVLRRRRLREVAAIFAGVAVAGNWFPSH